MQVIVIVGPTGVGKTKLSVELAKRLDGEIINADSTQIYKGLNIATAKVTEEETSGIPHHLFDIREVTEEYTVFDYQKDCRRQIEEITLRGKIPILVGGTGLYIKAALYDYQFTQESNQYDYAKETTEELWMMLKEKDPHTQIHPHNRKRMIRALQYMDQVGKPYSEKEKTNTLLYDTFFVGLTTDREYLYMRINERVDQMVADGLIEEAKKIYDSNIRTKAIMTPIGYKELFPYFEKNKTLKECLEEIKLHSRHYAKRQYTWFRNQMPVTWFSVDFEYFQNTIDEVIEKIRNHYES